MLEKQQSKEPSQSYLEHKVTGLQKRIIDIENENILLKDQIQQLKSDKNEVFKYSDNRFSDSMQKCVHKLLEHNVGASQVPAVIEVCLDLSQKKPKHDLPSDSTIRKMNLQRGIISSMWIREVLPTKENLTFATEKASHYGRKYETFNVTDSDSKLYVLGLRDILTKSGKQTT